MKQHWDTSEFVHELANKYTVFFDVYREEKLGDFLLSFYAIFRQRDERYMLSKKVKVYGIENQQIVFTTVGSEVTDEYILAYQEAIEENVKKYIPKKDEHMSTIVIGLVIIDQVVDNNILKKVMKYRKVKFLKFGLHGWLEFYTALINVKESSIQIHPKGKPFIHSIEKMLQGGK